MNQRSSRPFLNSNSSSIEYVVSWLIFTLFLSVFPLLFKLIVFHILSKEPSFSETVSELLFLSILLSADSMRIIQLSNTKGPVTRIVFWLNVPAIFLSMGFYGIFEFSKYAQATIAVSGLKILTILVVISSILFDICAQVLYLI